MGVVRILSGALCSIIVILVAVFTQQVLVPTVKLYMRDVCMGEGGRYVLRAAVSWYFGSRLIEEGDASMVVPSCTDEHAATCEWQALIFSLYTILGYVRIPQHCLDEAGVSPHPFLDHVAEFKRTMAHPPARSLCKSLLDYEHSPAPMIHATREDEEAFIAACLLEYRSLFSDERVLLDPMHRLDRIPQHFLRSWDVHAEEACAASTDLHEEYEHEPPLSREDHAHAVKHGLERTLDDADHKEESNKVWRRLDLRGPHHVGHYVDRTGQRLARGEIVRFHAQFRMHESVWNITAADLADLEGAEAERIPIVSPLPDANVLSLADFARRGSEGQVGYVNAKRLKKFKRKISDFAHFFRMEDTVLHTQHTLLFGQVRWPHAPPIGKEGCNASFQVNAEPNVYIQLTGEAKFLLIPQRYSDALTDCGRKPFHLPCGSSEDIRSLYGIPVVWIHLRAGDGFVLPARTHHILNVLSRNSVAINSFFVPHWRHLEFTEHDYYSKAARHALEHIALRQIWISSLSRMHNQTGKAVYSNHGLLEWF